MRHEVTDEGDARKYWTQIPNIVFDIGLSPYEMILYAHMKRTAGKDGTCAKSTRTLAKECRMSPTVVVKAKVELSKPRAELKRKPLIRISKKQNPNGGKEYDEVSIVDIWRENTNRFAPPEEENQVPDIALEGKNQVPYLELAAQKQVPREPTTSTIEHVKQVPVVVHKKNVREEELREEKQNPSAHAGLMDFLSTKIGHIPNGGQQGKAVKWLLERYDPVECFGCFNFLAGQTWRSTPVTWTTVQSNIGAWVTSRPISYHDPTPEKLLPLPNGVRAWRCTKCRFKVIQNGNGITQCPECSGELT